jgi:hypothetical protein
MTSSKYTSIVRLDHFPRNHETTSCRAQFHQCSMYSYYTHKFCAQLFCAYILGLHFTGARLLAQKLGIERWWNLPQVYQASSWQHKKDICSKDFSDNSINKSLSLTCQQPFWKQQIKSEQHLLNNNRKKIPGKTSSLKSNVLSFCQFCVQSTLNCFDLTPMSDKNTNLRFLWGKTTISNETISKISR